MVDTQDILNRVSGWMEKERTLGSPSPDRVVLATATQEGVPHSRVVAVREISSDGILFFTQQGTRKVTEINQNPHASMTLWLPLQQRQVTFDGRIIPLTPQENEEFWYTMPRERQLRFAAYAPTSGKPISSLSVLDEKFAMLSQQPEIPMSPYYCGFRLVPTTIFFYTLGNQSFSEFLCYACEHGHWSEQLLSP